MTNGGELINRCCGVNVASLCERGYSQPPQVLPLPDWDDGSTQIIHVDKFMSSITSTTLTHCPSPGFSRFLFFIFFNINLSAIINADIGSLENA